MAVNLLKELDDLAAEATRIRPLYRQLRDGTGDLPFQAFTDLLGPLAVFETHLNAVKQAALSDPAKASAEVLRLIGGPASATAALAVLDNALAAGKNFADALASWHDTVVGSVVPSTSTTRTVDGVSRGHIEVTAFIPAADAAVARGHQRVQDLITALDNLIAAFRSEV